MRSMPSVGEGAIAGVGHALGEIEEGLPAVVEVGRDDELAGEVEAEALGDVLRSRARHRGRRR